MNDHISKLKNLLKEMSLDAALISSVPDIIYLTDFSYFSTEEREAFLLITQNNNYIFTDGRYSHAVKTNLKQFKLIEISSQKKLSTLLEETIVSENIKQLGISKQNISIHEFETLLSPLKTKKIIQKIDNFTLSSLRKIKTQDEIIKVKKACEIGDAAFTQILRNIRKGISEKELAFELITIIRKNGAEISFRPIIAFEENAAVPHHQTSDRKLNKNEFVLMDFGVKFENYCSDMTRTLHFGEASPEKKRAYQTVLQAQQRAIEILNSKLSILNSDDKNPVASEIDSAARTTITAEGYPTIPHSLGHGIGLEVHEAPSLSPNSKDELTSGMVFSIEPGIYLNDKFGIRIEDLFTIENNKLIQLTTSPKTLTEL